MLESEIERKIGLAAKARGWRGRKLTSPGRKGVTDRFFTKKPGKIIFLEVKRPNEDPTELQLREHRRLRDDGFAVYVVDSVEEAIEIFDAHG